MKFGGIVISGLPCSGKSVLCKKLEIEYGWKIYAIGDMLRRKHENECKDGSKFPVWYENTSDEYNHNVNIEAEKIMNENSLIMDSRYGAFYKDEKPYFRMFLTADLEVRTMRYIRREARKNIIMNFEQAKKELTEREEVEYKRGYRLFSGRDYRDPKFYDIIIDSSIMSIDQELCEIRKKKNHLEISR